MALPIHKKTNDPRRIIKALGGRAAILPVRKETNRRKQLSKETQETRWPDMRCRDGKEENHADK